MKIGNWPDCEVCDKPVSRGKAGALSVCATQVKRREEEVRQWEKANEHEVEGVTVTYGSLGTYPYRVPWVWAHRDCKDGEKGCDCGYWFSGDRFDTTAKALGWTLHLMEKRWLASTEWEDAVRRFHHLNGGEDD